MKTNFYLIAVGAVSLFAASAGAVEIANWTFETSVPTTAGPHSPETGSGAATGLHASGSVVYSNPAGNGSVESFSSNFWGVGDYYQFQVSTVGMTGVTFTWDQTGSSTGPRDFKVQYSTNGTTFTDFGSAYEVLLNGGAPNASWNATTSSAAYSFAYDLSSVTALDNQANIYLRLTNSSTVAINLGTVATGGTSRVDNVIVSATPVPEPFTLGLAGLALAAAARRRARKSA